MDEQERSNVIALLEEMGNGLSAKEDMSWFNLHFNRLFETLTLLSECIPEGSTILDVGVSPGHMSTVAEKLGFRVHGIDINPESLQERFEKMGITVRKCDVEREPIPFNENMFDCVLFTEVLEHLSYYRVKDALNEIKRVLKRRGLLILSTPNLVALENRLFLLVGGAPFLRGGIISPAHNREYTLREVLGLLQEVGFSVKLNRYSLARDKVTHTSAHFISREHVLKSFLKNRNWINLGRALVYPLKLAVPSFRSCIFVVAEKA